MRSLTKDGNAGIDFRATSDCTRSSLAPCKTHDVLDEWSRRTREPASIVQRRFESPWNSVEYFMKSSENRAHCAAQAESSRSIFSVVCFVVH